MSHRKPKLEAVEGDDQQTDDQIIPKPAKFDLNKFKSTRPATIAGVNTQLTPLQIHTLAQAKDFCRLHPTEWSSELCFVSVPVKGARDTMHLIVEELAEQYLPAQRIIRHRLALASKPLDRFFLCVVPSCNLDNTWVASNLQACETAKTLWTQATSRRAEGVDGYNISSAADPDAFPEPSWPAQQGIDDLIGISFSSGDRIIDRPDHSGLLRLLGMKVT